MGEEDGSACAWSRLLCAGHAGASARGPGLHRDGRGAGNPGDVGQVEAGGPPDGDGLRQRGRRGDKGTPGTGRRRRPRRRARPRVRRRAARAGWSETERRCRFVRSQRLCSCLVVIVSSSSVPCRRVGMAAPRNEKGPGGWSRPGLRLREVVDDQDVSDERDATEVTGGHPSLGTTTLRRGLHRHGAGYMPDASARVKRSRRTSFTGRAACGEVPPVPPPRCSSPSPCWSLLLACGETPGSPLRPPTRPRSSPAFRPHHDGRPASAGRRPGGLAADAAARRRRSRPAHLPGGGLRLLPQGGGRGSPIRGRRRPGPGADGHGQPPSAGLLPGGDPQSRRGPGGRARAT